MRSFLDGDGRRWDVVAGRESWGGIVAIFLPREEGGHILEAPLDAAGYAAANEELDALDEEGLKGLLERARPKELGAC